MQWGIIGIIGLACAVWVIYDIFAKQKHMKNEHKILWAVAAVVFSIITALAYYFAVKEKHGKKK